MTAYTPIVALDIVDSSPKRIKKNRSILSLGNLQQAGHLLWRFVRKIHRADTVLIFGSNGFLLSLTPLLVLIAKLAGRPCFVRSFGGSLDQFATDLPKPLRWLLLFGFRTANGLIVETQLLHQHFANLLGTDSVYYVPGYRPMPETVPSFAPDAVAKEATSDAKSATASSLKISMGTQPLRLIFIAWVRVEKGVSILLEALAALPEEEQGLVLCDIYGPVLEEYRPEFERLMAQTPSAHYRGVVEPESVLDTMRTYDALIFPSFYAGEGHPGVVIESMAAGIPVITTRFRSIPELVRHGENGLLVEPGDAQALASALRVLLQDRRRLMQMGRENWKRRQEFEIERVLSSLVQPLIEIKS